MKKLLIQVDVQNVFYGSRNYTGGRGRVDYDKLIEVIEDEVLMTFGVLDGQPGEASGSLRDVLQTTVIGYVVKTPKYNGMGFFAFLKRIGYSLRVKHFPEGKDAEEEWRGTVSSMMQMDFIEHASNYDFVVVVSGSGVYAPAFKAAQRNWPDTKRGIAAFDNTMHKAYERKQGLVDLLVYLGDDVLREN